MSQITILHIFDRFRDHTTKKKKKFCHTRRHKLQPNTLVQVLDLKDFYPSILPHSEICFWSIPDRGKFNPIFREILSILIGFNSRPVEQISNRFKPNPFFFKYSKYLENGERYAKSDIFEFSWKREFLVVNSQKLCLR